VVVDQLTIQLSGDKLANLCLVALTTLQWCYYRLKSSVFWCRTLWYYLADFHL